MKITQRINAKPNDEITRRLELHAAGAMAGEGRTELYLYSTRASNGMCEDDDTDVQRLDLLKRRV